MRLRFRVRTLMLVVAMIGLVGGGLAGYVTERRRGRYNQRVDSFAYGEAEVIEEVAAKLEAARHASNEGPEGEARAEALRTEAEHLARLAAWHVKMERKYARAAEYPWEPVQPDPPPP